MRDGPQPPARSLRKFKMKYPNAEYRARVARAKKAARNLVVKCNWRLVDEPALMPPALCEGLTIRGADLVLIGSGGSHPFGLYDAMREVGVDALIIEPAATMANKPTFAATLLRRRRGTIEKTPCLRFWISGQNACFLLPDPEGDDADGTCFALEANGVNEVERPWGSEKDRAFGRMYADAVLLNP